MISCWDERPTQREAAGATAIDTRTQHSCSTSTTDGLSEAHLCFGVFCWFFFFDKMQQHRSSNLSIPNPPREALPQALSCGLAAFPAPLLAHSRAHHSNGEMLPSQDWSMATLHRPALDGEGGWGALSCCQRGNGEKQEESRKCFLLPRATARGTQREHTNRTH